MRLAHEALTLAMSVVSSVSEKAVYPYSRPKTGSDFIVVNALPTPNEVLQIVVVNINIHATDIQGYPNIKLLNDEAKAIIEAFMIREPDPKNYIDFRVMWYHIMQQQGMDEHYCNIRLEAYMLNNN